MSVALLLSPGDRLVAPEPNTMVLPSPETTGTVLGPLGSWPVELLFWRITSPVNKDLIMTSLALLLSASARLVASVSKVTNSPSSVIVAFRLAPLACTPVLDTDTRSSDTTALLAISKR